MHLVYRSVDTKAELFLPSRSLLSCEIDLDAEAAGTKDHTEDGLECQILNVS